MSSLQHRLSTLVILFVDETATRPFDLPYLTINSSAASTITCRVSDFMQATMPELSVEDSISRRGSHSSQTGLVRAAPRPNSHTQHAAAIAAANIGQSAALSGPRPPPSTVKEARPWNFTSFDSRTKVELAASVSEATLVSETRHHVGGPRALALSDKAIQTGVLPPPVCLAPKVVPLPRRELHDDNNNNKENTLGRAPSNGNGAWRKDWSALAADTGYHSAATTPNSTPAIGSYASHGSLHSAAANRCLSPVVEEARRLSGAVQRASVPVHPTYRPRQGQYAPAPAPSTSPRSYDAPAALNLPRTHTTPRTSAPQHSTPSYTTAATYNTHPSPPPPPTISGGYSYGSGSVSVPRPSPAPAPAPAAPARVRLARAQEALRVRGGRDTVVTLKRPARLTGDFRVGGGERRAVASAPAPVRPEYLRMPGSFEDY